MLCIGISCLHVVDVSDSCRCFVLSSPSYSMSSRQMTVLFIVLVSLFQVIREFRVGFCTLAAEFIAWLLGDHRMPEGPTQLLFWQGLRV